MAGKPVLPARAAVHCDGFDVARLEAATEHFLMKRFLGGAKGIGDFEYTHRR